MRSLREYVLALLLAAVGAIAWWLQGEQEAVTAPPADGARRPDYTVSGLTASLMNEDGHLHRRLTATQLRHYPNDGGSDLDDPRLTVFAEGGPPWIVRSGSGWVSEDGDELRLPGVVFIDREAGPNTRPVHLKTWDLYVKPRQDYAETDRPVHVTSNADWLASRQGTRVRFGEQLHLVLLGRVRAQVDVR
jgi:lipopolysaccharide export system protein LptC